MFFMYKKTNICSLPIHQSLKATYQSHLFWNACFRCIYLVAEMQRQTAAAAQLHLIEPIISTYATAADTSIITSTATYDSLSVLISSGIQKKATQKVLTISQRAKIVGWMTETASTEGDKILPRKRAVHFQCFSTTQSMLIYKNHVASGKIEKI